MNGPLRGFFAPAGHRLPTPGLAFGDYPQRLPSDEGAPLQAWARAVASRVDSMKPRSGRGDKHTQLPAKLYGAYQTALAGLGGVAALAPAAAQVRARLRREGLSAAACGQALALAALVMQRTQGLVPYNTQLLAAWLMLQGRLVEMATGEGKTVAAALAAAVAGLAGTPVHVLTANEYLVQRDQQTLAPFYAALGLRSACVTAALAGTNRHQAWRADVVYTTASQLAFDYLRDHLALGGERDARVLRAQAISAQTPRELSSREQSISEQAQPDGAKGLQATAPEPLLPGLCLCLLDEADSILLDEAVVPLILAAPAGQLDLAAHQRAFELASGLQRQLHYTLHAGERRATLTEAGRVRIHAAVAGVSGDLYPPRRACELVQAALAARLLYRRDRDYAVVQQAGRAELQLIDELSGRVAVGRQWQGALHPMVQIKEGLQPSPPTCTAAQITYQRFFPRYLHLAGMSGTLLEARHELHRLYGSPVQRLPLAQPCRRRWLGQRCYAHAADKWQAVLLAVQQHSSAGRPVLVGTDSVADSAHLSTLLHAAGVQHQLLNATQDSAEAEQVARAGQAGCVTVATNMAGRGTDIVLDAAARAAGGLHVIATMKNRSRRIDRQLVGRAARHGDPGSAEALLALDDALLQRIWPGSALQALALMARALRPGRRPAAIPVHPALAAPVFAVTQRVAEWRDHSHRRELRHADSAAAETYGFSGGVE